MLLGATFCYGLGNAWSRRRLTSTGLSNVALPAIQLAVGALVILPFAVSTPLVGPVAPAPALALLALGLGGTGLAYVLFWRVLAIAGATVTASVTYVIPLVSTTLGVLVLHEGLHWYEPVGGAVVLAGRRSDAVGCRAAAGRRGRGREAAASRGPTRTDAGVRTTSPQVRERRPSSPGRRSRRQGGERGRCLVEPIVRPTRRDGSSSPDAMRASIAGYSCAAMPWLP